MSILIISLSIFFIASFFEISGAFLIFKWRVNNSKFIQAIIGGLFLLFYGLIQSIHIANFGRVYAAYGGIFIISTLIWGIFINRRIPDKYDLIGMGIILLGVFVIFFTPR